LDNDSTKITEDYLSVLEESTIYPNPFQELFTVNSIQNDIFILQSINGKILGKYNVQKGETEISGNLSKGMYVGILVKQNQTFKIIKK
jgi:hypothetical protein